jgi:hypothetical protein
MQNTHYTWVKDIMEGINESYSHSSFFQISHTLKLAWVWALVCFYYTWFLLFQNVFDQF